MCNTYCTTFSVATVSGASFIIIIITVNSWHRFITFEQLHFVHGNRWFCINAFLFSFVLSDEVDEKEWPLNFYCSHWNDKVLTIRMIFLFFFLHCIENKKPKKKKNSRHIFMILIRHFIFDMASKISTVPLE